MAWILKASFIFQVYSFSYYNMNIITILITFYRKYNSSLEHRERWDRVDVAEASPIEIGIRALSHCTFSGAALNSKYTRGERKSLQLDRDHFRITQTRPFTSIYSILPRAPCLVRSTINRQSIGRITHLHFLPIYKFLKLVSLVHQIRK